MKKIGKILSWKPWVSGLVIGLVLALGITVSAMSLTGSVDEFKGLFGQDQSYLGGNVTATGGICSGGEPATTMCNVDINYLDVTTALEADGTFGVTGASTFTGAIGAGVVVTDAFTQGGGVRATSTVNSAETLLAADFDTENVIDYTLNLQDATLTLPASSTLSALVPTSGDMRSIVIRNATTTAAMDLTIAGGTGTLLKIASTTNTVYSPIITGDTDGANAAIITFLRKANTDIIAFFTMFKD